MSDEHVAKRRKLDVAQVPDVVYCKVAEEKCMICNVEPSLRYIYCIYLVSIRKGNCSLSQGNIAFLETNKDCLRCSSCNQKSS